MLFQASYQHGAYINTSVITAKTFKEAYEKAIKLYGKCLITLSFPVKKNPVDEKNPVE